MLWGVSMRVMAAGVRSRAMAVTQRLSRKPAAPAREVLAGRYELSSLLGRGGMAEVHAAYDRQLERAVAIKRPRQDMADDTVISDRLRREALALAAIDSPHVVAIHDVGYAQGSAFLVMQLVCGRTLGDELDRGPVTPARACRIAREVLAGLAAIHASGLVHRDLKASNILLDRSDRAVLLDLGAALHPRRRHLTAPGTVMGTPECMAPEQLEQRPLDGRVDLFQLGLILIHLVTGVRADCAVDPTRLAIPNALREVITCALSPVGERYASTAQMQSALDAALSGCTLEPIELTTPGKCTRQWPERIVPPRRTGRG
jgi:serine/threonine protein kinase